MRIECAALCDAATVREGLLHVLGAGVTNVTVPGLPAALPLTFACRAVLESRELKERHTLRLRLLDAMEREIAKAEIVFDVEDPEKSVRPTESALPVAIPLLAFAVPQRGRYLIEATLDNHALGSLPLTVAVAASSDETSPAEGLA